MLAPSLGVTDSSSPGWRVYRRLGGHSTVAPNCTVYGGQTQCQQTATEEGGGLVLLARAAGPGEKGAPTKAEASPCGCRELAPCPAVGSFCLRGAEHSQTHHKDRSGASLNTKPLSEPDCSETPPQKLRSCVSLCS